MNYWFSVRIKFITYQISCVVSGPAALKLPDEVGGSSYPAFDMCAVNADSSFNVLFSFTGSDQVVPFMRRHGSFRSFPFFRS